VNAEFNWWLLIVGLVIGAALTWLVMAEAARRDADLGDEERRGEAVYIASLLSSPDETVDELRVEEILRLHREYLAGPPPDEPADLTELTEADEIEPARPAEAFDPEPVIVPRASADDDRGVAAEGTPGGTAEPSAAEPTAPAARAQER
jgi:hypothetical protein